MQISHSKYHKVWKVQKENGYTKLDLGDSKKNKDGTYDNWSWFGCLLVGGAKDAEINEGDLVEIESGVINKRKYEGKYYDDVVIFAISVMKKTESKPKEEADFSSFESVTDECVPF